MLSNDLIDRLAGNLRQLGDLLLTGRGVGLACGSYLCGAGLPIYWNHMPQSGVMIKLDRSGGVAAFCGSTDIGQGSDSVLAYCVAEVLGIEPVDIRLVTGDTDLTPVDLGSYTSRVTLMMGNAAIQAAKRAKQQLIPAVADKLKVPPGRLVFADRRVFDAEKLVVFGSPVGARQRSGLDLSDVALPEWGRSN